MTALAPVKRNMTAEEMGRKLKVSARRVRQLIAQPRMEYEKEAIDRRKKAYDLHFNNGLKWKEVAEKMNLTENAVKALAKRFKQIDKSSRG